MCFVLVTGSVWIGLESSAAPSQLAGLLADLCLCSQCYRCSLNLLEGELAPCHAIRSSTMMTKAAASTGTMYDSQPHLLEQDAVLTEHAMRRVAVVRLLGSEEQVCHLSHAVALIAV